MSTRRSTGAQGGSDASSGPVLPVQSATVDDDDDGSFRRDLQIELVRIEAEITAKQCRLQSLNGNYNRTGTLWRLPPPATRRERV